MAANDNAQTCTTSILTFWELLAGALGKDAGGKTYLRLYAATNVSGSKAFACGDPVSPDEVENKIASCFALDANGDIALRAATATAGL